MSGPSGPGGGIIKTIVLPIIGLRNRTQNAVIELQ